MGMLEEKHRRFLLKETIISIVINTCLSFVITFFMFRSQSTVMLWGKGGVFLDLIPTIFVMTFCMTMVLTPATRSRIKKGKAPAVPFHYSEQTLLRFLPRALFTRSSVLAILGIIILLPSSTGLLVFLKEFPISFMEMLLLKTSYGALIGLLATPIILIGCGSFTTTNVNRLM